MQEGPPRSGAVGGVLAKRASEVPGQSTHDKRARSWTAPSKLVLNKAKTFSDTLSEPLCPSTLIAHPPQSLPTPASRAPGADCGSPAPSTMAGTE